MNHGRRLFAVRHLSYRFAQKVRGMRRFVGKPSCGGHPLSKMPLVLPYLRVGTSLMGGYGKISPMLYEAM